MSVVLLEPLSVSEPKRKPGRPESEVKTRPVRLPADLLEQAEWVAVYKRVKVGRLLADILRPVIERQYKAVEKPD